MRISDWSSDVCSSDLNDAPSQKRQRMSRFRPIDRDTDYLLPPSVQDWLPPPHLARYVVDVVEGLDSSELERAYAGSGSAAYHPALLVSLLLYVHATGTHPIRNITPAPYDRSDKRRV